MRSDRIYSNFCDAKLFTIVARLWKIAQKYHRQNGCPLFFTISQNPNEIPIPFIFAVSCYLFLSHASMNKHALMRKKQARKLFNENVARLGVKLNCTKNSKVRCNIDEKMFRFIADESKNFFIWVKISCFLLSLMQPPSLGIFLIFIADGKFEFQRFSSLHLQTWPRRWAEKNHTNYCCTLQLRQMQAHGI